MKKILSLVLAIFICTFPVSAIAAVKDVPASASYYGAVQRVTSLGLMDNVGSNTFKPNDKMAREQFAKMLVLAVGLSDSADLMKGTTAYSDVPSNGAYNGYINLCISKGYMSGMADGKFHPKDAVTLSQAVTAMLRAIGYTNSDIPGTWPKNYIEKAKALGITTGIPLSSSANVPRWAMAQMLDKLLDTDIRSANASEASKTLAESVGLTLNTMYTVYSKPVVYYKSQVAGGKIGTIDLSGKLSIVRNSVDNTTDPVTKTNGESIKTSDIKDFNILYQVSDKSGKNKYVLVIDNKISGVITGILPNKYTPKQIEVDDKTYDLDSSFNVSKLSGTNSFSINDSVTLLLGYDGKVVDIQEALYSDNSSFAFVKNYTSITSNDTKNYGIKLYTVKLLLSNGSTATYDTNTEPSSLKGKMVIYTKQADGSVSLTPLNYSTPGRVTILKSERKILSDSGNYSYDFAGNVKIFNFLSNNDEVDAQAQILNWSDLPSGDIESGKIIFMNKTGSFNDVNMIYLNNITARDYKTGVVKSCTSKMTPSGVTYTFTITVNGADCTYSSVGNDLDLAIGSVLEVIVQNNTINSIVRIKYADAISNAVQAVDTDRIRVANKTYTFSSDKLIYLIDNTGSVKSVSTSLLKTNTLYGNVSVYTDKPLNEGGLAELVIIKGS